MVSQLKVSDSYVEAKEDWTIAGNISSKLQLAVPGPGERDVVPARLLCASVELQWAEIR